MTKVKRITIKTVTNHALKCIKEWVCEVNCFNKKWWKKMSGTHSLISLHIFKSIQIQIKSLPLLVRNYCLFPSVSSFLHYSVPPTYLMLGFKTLQHHLVQTLLWGNEYCDTACGRRLPWSSVMNKNCIQTVEMIL